MGGLFQGGVFFCVGCKLSSQAKVDFAHCIESWNKFPHGRKDMYHRADVLLHALLMNGLMVGREDTYADLVSKYL